jgi:hypothetical protein
MSDTENGPERRAAPRIGAKGALAAYHKQSFLAGLFRRKKAERAVPIRNISSSGACFLCPERLRLNQKLTMRVRLAEKGPNVVLVARVLWCAKGRGIYPFQVGVQFVEFKGDAWRIMSRLEEHVVQRNESSAYRLRGKRANAKQETPAGQQEERN